MIWAAFKFEPSGVFGRPKSSFPPLDWPRGQHGQLCVPTQEDDLVIFSGTVDAEVQATPMGQGRLVSSPNVIVLF